jgi:hypothetical protein
MQIHTKTALILFATLIIGLVLGALVSGPLLFHHLDGQIGPRLSEHFVRRFEELIDPGEEQKNKVHSILENHAANFMEMHHRHRAEMETLMDSLHTELFSVLTDEERERLEESLDRHRGFREGPPFRRRGFGRKDRPGGQANRLIEKSGE